MKTSSLVHRSIDSAIGKIKIVQNKTSQKHDALNPRVLCLHGWLDNRASFIPLLPYLKSTHCVAIDFVGHGQSTHRGDNALYHYIDYVRDIKLIMDALGWEDCHILGHSMGGALGLLAANAYPNKIQSLSLIDILHPLTRDAKDGPAMLQKSLAQFEHWDSTREKTFPNLAAAVKARLLASPFPQSKKSAELIMQYASKEVENGRALLSDARLNFKSPTMLNAEQINAFIQAARLPIMAILADEGISKNRTDVDETVALFQNMILHKHKGKHHIHMDEPKIVSELFLAFLESQA